mgnify:CR=1 FL=1
MEKSKSLKDNKRIRIVPEEVDRFKSIIKGHEKLLNAIGKL